MQNLIAYFIVVIAITYVGWQFMPQSMRRRLLVRLIALLPVSYHARFARLQSASQNVGCSTCKGCSDGAPTAAHTIRMHRR